MPPDDSNLVDLRDYLESLIRHEREIAQVNLATIRAELLVLLNRYEDGMLVLKADIKRLETRESIMTGKKAMAWLIVVIAGAIAAILVKYI